LGLHLGQRLVIHSVWLMVLMMVTMMETMKGNLTVIHLEQSSVIHLDRRMVLSLGMNLVHRSLLDFRSVNCSDKNYQMEIRLVKRKVRQMAMMMVLRMEKRREMS